MFKLVSVSLFFVVSATWSPAARADFWASIHRAVRCGPILVGCRNRAAMEQFEEERRLTERRQALQLCEKGEIPASDPRCAFLAPPKP